MLLRLLLLLLLLPTASFAEESLLGVAIAKFDRLTSYQATMRSYGGREQIVFYRYQSPGFVRIDFVKPHKGAALVYRPDTGKVILRPFGFSSFFTLTLNPANRLVRSSTGHRVDQSDLGVLLQNAEQLAAKGEMLILGDDVVEGQNTALLQITGPQGGSVAGVNRYLLWLDKSRRLPLRVESYDAAGGMIEGLLLEGLEIDPVFGEIFSL